MADRDIPSVPVTTLAGLSSLSDLLSELPISESSVTTSLYKSLLFHPRVAEEANNLLSIKDDNLTRQLVHAIEQTNADHIELKSQYAEQHSSGTNINELPQLLQAIHTLKPTVFKTGSQQQQRQGNTPQLWHPHHSTNATPQQQQQQQQQIKNQAQFGGGGNNQLIYQNKYANNVGQQNITSIQQQNNVLQPTTSQSSTQPNYNMPLPIVSDVVVKQEPQSTLAAPHFVSIQQQQQEIDVQQISAESPIQQQQQQQLYHHQQQQQQQYSQQFPTQQYPVDNLNQILPAVDPLFHTPVPQQLPAHHHHQQQQQQQQPQQQNVNIGGGGVSTIQQYPPTHQQQHQPPPPPQQSNQTSVISNRINSHIQQTPQTNFTNHSIENHIQSDLIVGGGGGGGNGNHDSNKTNQSQSKMVPRNNEYLEKQSKISDIRGGPSPAQASDAPIESNQTYNQTVLRAPQKQQPAVTTSIDPYQKSVQPQQQLQWSNTQQQQQQQPAPPLQSPSLQSPSIQSPQQQSHIQNQTIRPQNIVPPQLPPQQNQQFRPQQQQQQHQQQQPPPRIIPSNSLAAPPPSSIQPPQNNANHLPTTNQQNQFLNPNTMNNNLQQPNPMKSTQSTQPLSSSSSAAASTSTTTSSSSSSSSKSKSPKVVLTRLKPEDIKTMEESLSEFAKNSPYIAYKMGIVNDSSDMFTQMKADERRSAKRRMAIPLDDDDIKFTQPKLRKISHKLSTPMKFSKEDIIKSQTYQQFMRNMEHELRRLEETEQPNNLDDMDYYTDCISSKTLIQLTNDVAKLKAKGCIDAIPKNKLTLLINFAMRNVDIARNCSAGPDMDDDNDESIDKILGATEACLLVSNIYATANDVKFLQEDNMERIVKFVQFQMRETIFPSYDPVFSVKSMKKPDKKKKSSNAGGYSGGLTRNVQLLYTKLVELTKIFVTLFDNCSFVDTIVLNVATLAVEPFFVDNIETLQFACLELVTTIFRKESYVKYRSSILTDILTSVDRLPCSKKNLRPYKLINNGGSIQMVTALVLQLIQCSSVLPVSLSEDSTKNNRKKSTLDIHQNQQQKIIDKDLLILEKYDTAFSIGGNFLTTFLNKCKSRSGETDFRPLFENFIYDLLTTVNKPEWPASELLLSLLGTLLVKYMSDKSIEQAIRVVSLDYLGIVAARLRKDTVESRCKVNTMDALIKCIKLEQEKEGDQDGCNKKIVVDPEEERTEFLQKMLLDFLAVNAQEDNLIWDYARHFYLTQWYKDVIQRKKKIAEGEKGYASRKKNAKKKRKYGTGGGGGGSDGGDSSNDENDDDDDDEDDVDNVNNVNLSGNGGSSKLNRNNSRTLPDQELNLEIFRILDERKRYFLQKIKPFGNVTTSSSTTSGGGVGGVGGAELPTVQDIRTYIDYSNAHLIAQYLASKRQFSQSFDKYLQKIILVVREPSIAIRTKAMKCLAMIVEVDPSILKRKDMQMGVSQKLLDTSISVREAAVDLVGKYVLSSVDLIDQYYEMLSKRILDTGVSVRKRVIKILRDICIEYPDFTKIPEICVKMIRRVNDEEGIQKLVTEVFMRMWFSPCDDNDKHSIKRKINQMTDVVSMAHDTGTQWLDGLLQGIFKPKEEKDITERNPNAPKKEPPKEVIKACQQLADGLVDAIILYEGTDNKRVLSCITTLNLLAKVRPQLLVKHAMTLEPYLNIKGNVSHIVRFIGNVAEVLEYVVPLMEHPSESFLADLETHLMMLVCQHNQTVVNSCLSCLGAVVNRITRNYKLIRDCFTKCYKPILLSRNQLESHPEYPVENIFKPQFRRGLFTIGLIFRFFDFKLPNVYGEGLGQDANALPATICSEIFDHLIYFARLQHNDIRRESLIAIGHFCIKNYDYLTNHLLRDYYCDLLKSNEYSVEIKITVLRNIINYLNDADESMTVKEKDWQTQSLVENLGDMGDVMSGMASQIIQLYLRDVLNSLLHFDFNVRFWSLKLIQAVLRQGLVHPVQIVPYLICLSTDHRKEIAHRADHHLQELDKQYPGFVNMRCHLGIQLSYDLQRILQLNGTNTVVRGFHIKDKDEQPTALNGFLYTLLRNTKPQRRALVQSITKQFDEQRTTLHHMLYLADNLAYFPYVVQDEPLYIIHQIDLFVTCTGTNILQTFKDNLIPLPGQQDKDPNKPPNVLEDEDDDEDIESLLTRIPEDSTELQKCIMSAQGCILLLVLKQHLKTYYRITEGKISRYSPSESAKVYEKSMQRHPVEKFHPKSILEIILTDREVNAQLNEDDKKLLIERYLDFKQLMLKIDKEDSDNDSDRPQGGNKSVPITPVKGNANAGVISNIGNHSTNDSTGDPDIIHVSTTPAPNLNSCITYPNKENSFVNSNQPIPTTAQIQRHHFQQQQHPPPSSHQQQQQQQQHQQLAQHVITKQTPPRSASKNHQQQQQQNSSSRKQPIRSKRKKRKLQSSSEDSDSDDSDYV